MSSHLRLGLPKGLFPVSQSASRNKILVLESELNSLVLARDTGIATDEAKKRLETLRKDIQQEKDLLKQKVSADERRKKVMI